jgi:transglutaminase-like putative cysteine protease
VNRFAIREGWTTVFLTAMVVYISVWSIFRADWADGLGILNWIAFAGLGAGVLVSKWRYGPPIVGHLLALLIGVVVILFQMTHYLDDRIGSRTDKLAWLWTRGQRWVELIWNGEQTDDLYLFVLFISVLTFLLAFSSMWFVLRARWIWAALVFPALLLFINLGYSHRVPTSYVAMYLFFAILLLVRFHVLERETTWRRLRMDYPSTLAWRGMWAASYLAILVLVFGWVLPVSARSARAHETWTEVNGPWRSIEQRFEGWFGGLRGTGGRGIGGFASFSDSFDIGGPLRLSDTPVVLVSGSSAPYLAAHRYSVYTGFGWEAEVSRADLAADATLTPQVELSAGESVPLSPEVVENRAERKYTLELRQPRGNLVFSPEVFGSADIGVNLVVPWVVVTDGRYSFGDDLSELPSELRPLAEMLAQVDFTPQPAEPDVTPTPTADSAATGVAGPTPTPSPTPSPTPTPVPEPAPEPAEVTRERQLLAERGIIANYDIDQGTWRALTLRYSGTFPNYDDVEAVYARDGLEPGQKYAVTAFETSARGEDLRAAPAVYPDEITSRYLQLPDTITPRTRDLAALITANATNTYDMALAVENWLRTNIVYTEDVPFPPENQDVVDFVLFDSRAGYCEYYASSFVVMMRSLGVPTRMVTGFFPADRDAEAGGFLYRERNAHAWPEVYFEGYGWVPFEPTAARSQFNREPAPANPVVGGISPESGASGDFLPEDMLPDFGLQRPIERGGGIAVTGGETENPVTSTEWAVRAVSFTLMALVLLVLFLWLRGMRGLTPTEQLYTKFARGASWSGVRPTPSMTPHEYAQTVSKVIPGSRAPATYLADTYVKEMDLLRARQAWLRLRGLLLRHAVTRLRPWSRNRTEPEDDEVW